MKKLFLLVFFCAHAAYAIRSLPDASKRFQSALNIYLQDPTSDNAQDVVDEYDSTENTDKYRRTFDSTLKVNGLTINQLRSKAAAVMRALAPTAPFTPAPVAPPAPAMVPAAPAPAPVSPMPAPAPGTIPPAPPAPPMPAPVMPGRGLGMKAPASPTRATGQALGQIGQQPPAAIPSMPSAQPMPTIPLATPLTQKQQDALDAAREAQEAQEDLLEAHEQGRLAREALQKAQDELQQIQADRIQAENLELLNGITFEQLEAYEANLALLEGLPLEIGAFNEENSEVQATATELDQAQSDVYEAQNDVDVVTAQILEKGEKLNELDALVSTINLLLSSPENLEKFENIDIEAIADPKNALRYGFLAAMAANALMQGLGILEAMYPDKAEAYKKFTREKLSKLSIEWLLMEFTAASDKILQEINNLKLNLIDYLINVDESAKKLIEYEKLLQEKIIANRKLSLTTFEKGIAQQMTKLQSQITKINDLIAKIQNRVGNQQMNARTAGYYQKLLNDKKSLEERLQKLTSLENGSKSGITRLDNKMSEFSKEHKAFTDELQKVIQNRKQIKDTIQKTLKKPSVLAATTIDEIIKKGGDFVQHAESVARENAKKLQELSEYITKNLNELTTSAQNTLKNALQTGLKEADPFILAEIKTPHGSPKAPTGFNLPEKISRELAVARVQVSQTMSELKNWSQAVASQDAKTLQKFAKDAKARAGELKIKAQEGIQKLQNATNDAAKAIQQFKQQQLQQAGEKLVKAKVTFGNESRSLSARVAQVMQDALKLLKRAPK
ncbi:MAG: hypothetical protein K2X90_03810 [Candidatus Babeliaceae bacterium]|nr:hypothetical protein [Candidatus Babeliaceae bacterium]